MPQLLLELLSEEIPARMQIRAADDLRRLVLQELDKAGLQHDSARSFVTPRRLSLVVEGLPFRQPDHREERRGPRVDAPQKAIEGFLRANGLTREECVTRETGKGEFLFAVREVTGQETASVLVPVLTTAIERLAWPKSMRWGVGTARWVRPLRQILCVLSEGDQKLPLDCQAASGRLKDSGAELWIDTTSGHRFLSPARFSVSNFADYQAGLRSAHVMIDHEERREVIRDRATKIAQAEGLELRDDPWLLEEVAGLTEWPVVLCGRIDPEFMEVPDDVLITSMRTHQKYFSLLRPDGSLAPRFIVVAGSEAPDGGAAVVAGNERVLRARLSDARFFWDQDRKLPLGDRLPSLDGVVFHENLGTLGQKVGRICRLASEIAGSIPDCDETLTRRAARLAKADLVTDMVGEFPELQGVMGRYYALHDGEHPEVAEAIAEHYSPAGPADGCPDAPVSIAVALADKLDTLVGFFAINEKPTGSRDPFALRRAALGIIRLILENNLRLPLAEVCHRAWQGYGDVTTERLRGAGETGRDILDFIAERLKVHLRDRGVSHDHIAAVFALGDEDDLVRLMSRVRALSEFLSSDDGANLLTAYRRASNIVAIEEKRNGVSFGSDFERKLLACPEERSLVEELQRSSEIAVRAINSEEYVAAMKAMSALRRPVDLFFDNVVVNDENQDLRINRLRLLSTFRSTLGRIGDFSLIES